MSRIGKLPIAIPQGVTVSQEDHYVTVKGPKGELKQYIDPRIEVSIEDGEITILRHSDERQERSLHGLYRQLIHNMVTGVHEEFTQTLELIGVGYRATNQGQILELSLGFTHSIYLVLPNEIKVETEMVRNQTPKIILKSCDKQLLGQVCAKIRSFRKPEPYKGKGVRFLGEEVRRKSGKTAAK